MDAVWINFFYHPLTPLGILMSGLAVLAFLVLLRGFLSSVMYLFTLNGNDDFLKPARIRVLWAFLLLILFFCIWELLRWVGTILTGDPPPRGLGTATVLLIVLGVGVLGAKYLKKNAP